MNKLPIFFGLLHGTIGAIYSFYFQPFLVIYSLIYLFYKIKIKMKKRVILPVIGFSLICFLGSISNFNLDFYIYSEIMVFLVIPILFRTEKSIKFMVNVQFLFILAVTIMGIISTVVTLNDYDSVKHMKSVSETWMWPFIIYGGLNGLLYAYGLLLPIFVFLLNTRHHKIGIFVLLSIPFVMLNIVSGWHGKGIIGSYILSILFIMAVKYRFIFWLSIAVSLCALAVSNIDYDRLFEMVFSNARSLEYINIMSLGYSEAPSVESLYIRLYYLYGLPAVVSSVIIVACCLWLGLIAYVYSSPQNAELWLFVFFLFSFFATTFLTTTLFSLFVPSVFLAWSFYFYIVANNRHLVPSKLKSSS